METLITKDKQGVIKDEFFPNKDDAWDAMAVSICHANMYKFKDKTG